MNMTDILKQENPVALLKELPVAELAQPTGHGLAADLYALAQQNALHGIHAPMPPVGVNDGRGFIFISHTGEV